MVELYTREDEALMAQVRHYYDKLSDAAKAEFVDSVSILNVHPGISCAVLVLLGFFAGLSVHF